MQNKDFSGGINTRLDATLIAPNEAIVCNNVDTSANTIASSKGVTATAISAVNTPAYFESNQSWEDRVALEYIEYDKKLYFTQLAERPDKYNGTDVHKLGIKSPIEEVIPTADLISLPDDYSVESVSYSVYFGITPYKVENYKTGSYTDASTIADPPTDEVNIAYTAIFKIKDRNNGSIVVKKHPIVWSGNLKYGYRTADLQSIKDTKISEYNVLHKYMLQLSVGVIPASTFPAGAYVDSDAADIEVEIYCIDTAEDQIVKTEVVSPNIPVLNVSLDSTIYQTAIPTVHDNLLISGRINEIGLSRLESKIRYSEVLKKTYVKPTGADTYSFDSSSRTDSVVSLYEGVLRIDASNIDYPTILYVKYGLNYYRLKRIQANDVFYYTDKLDVNIHSITNVSNSNPCVLTLDTDLMLKYKNNDAIKITNLFDYPEINNRVFVVLNPDYTANTVELYEEAYPNNSLSTVNSLNSATYVSGGYVQLDHLVGGSGVSNTNQYVMTFYNALDGTESPPSDITGEITSTASVRLTNLEVSSDAQVTHKRIYRVGNNLLSFTFVGEIANDVTEFTDVAGSDELSGNILDSIHNYAPPVGLRYLRQVYGTFFGSLENKLYFTRDVGNPNYWPALNYIEFPDTITGIGTTPSHVVVFTKFKSYAITGSNAYSFVRHNMDGGQGCLSNASIVEYKNQLIFVSSDGICATQGTTVSVISKVKLGKIALDVVNAVLHDETYYLQLVNGDILAFDFRYTPSLKYFNFGTSYLVVSNDELYGKVGTVMSKLFSGGEVSYTYTTGDLTDGLVSVLKRYNKVFINCIGTHNISVFIDNILSSTFTGLATGTHKLHLPYDKSEGYSIRYALSGIGTVREITHKVDGRKDGD